MEEAKYRLRLKEMEYDRRLTELQKDHADRVSALLKQANAVGGTGNLGNLGPMRHSHRAVKAKDGDGPGALNEMELQRLVKFYKEQMEVSMRCPCSLSRGWMR